MSLMHFVELCVTAVIFVEKVSALSLKFLSPYFVINSVINS